MRQNNSERLTNAIEAAKQYGRFYCKFISANDADLTGAHQVGLYIAKPALANFYQKLDPTNSFNVGIGHTSKLKYWGKAKS